MGQQASGKPIDEGDTLVEILVAIVIMGIAFAAILGGFGMSIKGSSIHQDQANEQAQVRNASEQLKDQAFVACAGVGATPNYSATVTSGFHADVTPPQIWDNNGLSYVTATFSNCALAQLQRMTLTVCLSTAVVGGACPTSGSQSLTLTRRAP